MIDFTNSKRSLANFSYSCLDSNSTCIERRIERWEQERREAEWQPWRQGTHDIVHVPIRCRTWPGTRLKQLAPCAPSWSSVDESPKTSRGSPFDYSRVIYRANDVLKYYRGRRREFRRGRRTPTTRDSFWELSARRFRAVSLFQPFSRVFHRFFLLFLLFYSRFFIIRLFSSSSSSPFSRIRISIFPLVSSSEYQRYRSIGVFSGIDTPILFFPASFSSRE